MPHSSASPPLSPSRGLGLISGGLDSILAALILRRAGVEVEGVSFTTPFFDAENARRAATAHDLPLTVMEVGEEHLETVVKNPRYGYGANMNPCVDCHAFMLKKAGQLMAEKRFDFLFTGEVLGQRPMSQNKQALFTVAKASGLPDKVLRPLSAKLLPVTPMEEAGLVDRELLLDLSGRARKPQMALAAQFGVQDYPSPAGGCLLTEPGFSRRLKDLLLYRPQAGVGEMELLKYGRHLRLSPDSKLIVGRNQNENQMLSAMIPPGAISLAARGLPGPVGLFFGPAPGPDLELAAAVVAGYGKAPAKRGVQVEAQGGFIFNVLPLDRRQAHGMLL